MKIFNTISKIIYMKFHLYYFHKTLLNIAVEKQNIEIVNLLFKNKGLDVNITSIFFNEYLFCSNIN